MNLKLGKFSLWAFKADGSDRTLFDFIYTNGHQYPNSRFVSPRGFMTWFKRYTLIVNF